MLELARSGADLAGVVSFHGGLDTPTPADAKNIKCKVLVLHGGDDPHVPRKDVEAFEDEMRAGGVDWQLVIYGGAVHGFTNPGSATTSPGAPRTTPGGSPLLGGDEGVLRRGAEVMASQGNRSRGLSPSALGWQQGGVSRSTAS